MSIETNKHIMQRFTEFINTASEKLAVELISPNAVFHVPGRPEPLRGPAGYLEIIGLMRGGFPDIQWTLEEMIAESDKVAARFTMRGTHQGAFFGAAVEGDCQKTGVTDGAALEHERSHSPGKLAGENR